MDDYEALLKSYAILRWFKYDHLPPTLQAASRPFCELALSTARLTPTSNAEIATALRKLLEAKDAAVRGIVP